LEQKTISNYLSSKKPHNKEPNKTAPDNGSNKSFQPSTSIQQTIDQPVKTQQLCPQAIQNATPNNNHKSSKPAKIDQKKKGKKNIWPV